MASIMVYDPTIRDHLKRSDVTLEELKKLRTQARALIKQQGNVALALIDLDEEIERRSGSHPSR
jgi:hypothetical protein